MKGIREQMRKQLAPGGGTRRTERAFTLIELLVVFGVIAILLSIGLGVYFGLIRTTALQGERGAVVAIIQAARAAAISERGETCVCIDSAHGSLYPFGLSEVGVWQFESLRDESGARTTRGAFGHYGLVSTPAGGELVDGKFGKAIRFDGTFHLTCKMSRAGVWANIPTYDTREGLAIEAWVRPSAQQPSQTIIARPTWFRLGLTYDPAKKMFALDGLAVTLGPDDHGYFKHSARTAAVIRPDEWTQVSLSCHKLSPDLTLKVNGVAQVPDAAASESAADPGPAEETVVGADPGDADPFRGELDALILSAYAVGQVHKISEQLKLAGQGLAEGGTIRFTEAGRLAPVHDGATPKVILKNFGKPNTLTDSVTITVGTMGAVDVEVWTK